MSQSQKEFSVEPAGSLQNVTEEDTAKASEQFQDKLNDPPQRLAVYTHDTFGMGHVRRCFNIIEAICQEHSNWPILFISGSPALSQFEDRPKNVDVLKLPTLAPTGEADNQPPNLPIATREIISIRKRVIKSALAAFQPDVFLVDNFALGARKELLPSLEMLSELSTQTVLGLRDIVEDPEKTKQRWAKEKVYDALQEKYDHILVYGHANIFDASQQYDLSQSVADKITYCGYVTRAAAREAAIPPSPRSKGDSPGTHRPSILVTVGGGGDGLPLINAFFDAAPQLTKFDSLVVTGPMMGNSDRGLVAARAEKLQNVEVRDYVDNFVEYLHGADVLLCMGGYNTASELLALGRRAIIVPRDWRFGEHAVGVGAGAEMEQILRADALAAAGFARVIRPEYLHGDRLAAAILEEFSTPTIPEPLDLSVNGAEVAAEVIVSLAANGRKSRHGG